MSRITRPSEESRRDITFQPGPINKVPPEIVSEIFKFAVLSSEEARSHGVKALCLVDQDWNHIAKGTSDLWTKITFTYPLHADQLSAARKWLKTSEQKPIDVEIDLCDPGWDELGMEAFHLLEDLAPIQDMTAALRGSEHRWRSISIRSDTWRPIYEFLQAWEIPSLPLLETISLERGNEVMGVGYIREDPLPSLGSLTLFGSNGTLMPKLREVSLIAVHVDWASAANSFRDLRKLEIKNQHHRVGPTSEQFATLLAATPRLEMLDVAGYCPDHGASPTQVRIPPVHLTALKHFGLGWSCFDCACDLLMVLQIPESLESLSLNDTESGLGARQDEETDLFTYNDDSTPIFELLTGLEPAGPGNKDPSNPWISILGLKTLSVSWAESDHPAVLAFLENAPMIEEIRLTDVSQGVLEGIAALVETHGPRSLKKLSIQWIWNDGYESPEAHLVADLLGNHGFQVTVEKFTGPDGGLTPMALEALFNNEGGKRGPRSTRLSPV